MSSSTTPQLEPLFRIRRVGCDIHLSTFLDNGKSVLRVCLHRRKQAVSCVTTPRISPYTLEQIDTRMRAGQLSPSTALYEKLVGLADLAEREFAVVEAA